MILRVAQPKPAQRLKRLPWVTGDETLTLTDPQWLTHSRFQYGVSPGYARSRVFLAGDAGHLSLPIGGQGMNAGLHDAVEIAWRLAMTLRGEAAPVILDSYDGERGGEHARLSAQQARGFRWTVYRGPVTDTVLGLAAKALPNLSSLLQGTDDMQQMGVSYPKSSLNEDRLSGLATLLRPGPKPGERAPDAEVTHRGETKSLFRFLYNRTATPPDGRSCASTAGPRTREPRCSKPSAPSRPGPGSSRASSWWARRSTVRTLPCSPTWTARLTGPTAWRDGRRSCSSVRTATSPSAATQTGSTGWSPIAGRPSARNSYGRGLISPPRNERGGPARRT
jgi:hypothetical protein